MKKKLFVLAGIASIATLASCSSAPVSGGSLTYDGANKPEDRYTYQTLDTTTNYTALDNKNLDIYINYEGESGVTFRGVSWNNTIDGYTYTQGSLLPTWRALGDFTGINVREASGYKATSNDNAYTSVATAGYRSEINPNRAIDLFYNSIDNLREAGNAGSLIDLTPYIENGSMPNLKAYLDAHPAIKDSITINGKIYYTPYLDGDNDLGKTLIMDTTMVTKVLANKGAGDTGTINGGTNPSANVVKKGAYTPFIETDDTTVKILKNGEATNITTANVTNIIESQNALLMRNDGCTGKDLADQLIDYINEKYGDTYSNPADLYISESAAYNVDELVALMRVIKANPGLITGDPNAEIEVFFPRGETASSIENVYDLAQLWGVQGVDSENGNYYFAADGTLNSLETTKASYEALRYISALYDEGLILDNFYYKSTTSTATRYLDQYFKKTTVENSYGFMMYDDASIVTAANDATEGVGTASSQRVDKEYSAKGIYSVLPPRTYWATSGNTAKQSITDHTNKELVRYYESNRSLQTTSWSIPASSDNVDAAIRMMDFMYSELGQLVQNYGPSEYWAASTKDSAKVTTGLVSNGEVNAILSLKTKLELVDSQEDFWSFMRGYLGAAHGIGYVRKSGLNLQATNTYGQSGLANIQNAIAKGVCYHATSSDTYSWNVSVPNAFSTSVTDDGNNWDGITGFWQADKVNKNEGWVNVVIQPYYALENVLVIKTAKNGKAISYEDMLKEQTARDTMCLYILAHSLNADDSCVPAYAKTTA